MSTRFSIEQHTRKECLHRTVTHTLQVYVCAYLMEQKSSGYHLIPDTVLYQHFQEQQ